MQKKSICLYSELEPYSGSISNDSSEYFFRLIRDLKFACLFYDTVIIHIRNIIEHRLTLPAFEIMSPFVQSGKLWTSATKSLPVFPIDYVFETIEKFYGTNGKILTRKRNAEIEKLKKRWCNITPPQWTIYRTANVQMNSALSNIDRYLSQQFATNKLHNAHHIKKLVEDMQSNNLFNRHITLLQISKLRGIVPYQELAELATAVQAEYVRGGTTSKSSDDSDIVIYPGKSAQYLRNPCAPKLPFDYQTFSKVQERLKIVGINLNELLNLSASNLFDIVQTTGWMNIRNILLDKNFGAGVQGEMRAIFATNNSFSHKLKKLLNTSSSWDLNRLNLSPLVVYEPWGLVNLSVLGSANVNIVDNELKDKIFILDLDTHVFYEKNNPNCQIVLKKQQVNLISILIISGKSGLTIENIKQLLLEVRYSKSEIPKWHPQAKSDDSIRNSIDKLKSETDKKLKLIGLNINAKKGDGIWYLDSEKSDGIVNFRLSSTVWGEVLMKEGEQYTPEYLSKQQKLIWNCLWKERPKFVHAKGLAETLKKVWNEKTQKQISDAIYKLKQRLTDEKWEIKQSYSIGEYALVLKNPCEKGGSERSMG